MTATWTATSKSSSYRSSAQSTREAKSLTMTLTTSANLKVSLYTGPTTLISLLRAHFWGLDGVSSAEEGVREAPCFAREPPPLDAK